MTFVYDFVASAESLSVPGMLFLVDFVNGLTSFLGPSLLIPYRSLVLEKTRDGSKHFIKVLNLV